MGTDSTSAPPADPQRQDAPLTVAALRELVSQGSVDTVILALPDLEGRLQGKRFTAQHFLDAVAEQGTEGCRYLLATNVEMEPIAGNRLVGWSTGFGDFKLDPDLSTLRCLPWEPATALVLADPSDVESGEPFVEAPRNVLRRQLERLASLGFHANASTELEFIAFHVSYREAWEQRYRELTPTVPYNNDYAIFDGGGIEPLMRRIRNEMQRAGMRVEGSKGEANRGQQEINFRYGDAMRIADEHAIYKAGAKEIARQAGMAITFMAKYDEREGNSCHVHVSLTDGNGANVFAAQPRLLERFVAGQLACLREFTLLYAPQVNSYKRYVSESFAPTVVAWGRDNRTCPIRLLGHGESLRVENRLPGADVHPHLAIAAVIAAGLFGVEHELELEPPVEGSAYEADRPRVPRSLQEASAAFGRSAAAREAFGDRLVDHYVTRAEAEAAAAAGVVTEWERVRGFERL